MSLFKSIKNLIFKIIIQKCTLTRIGGKCSRCIDVSTLRWSNIVVSAGAGLDVSFEEELVEKFQAKLLIFDPSPTGIQTCQRVLGEFFFPLEC
jgi:hypothetical protein